MKQILQIVLVAIICLIIFNRKQNYHSCRWDMCPYKGITPNEWHSKVSKYTGEKYSDSWCIDMLHLEYPDKEYDELEDILFR